jgi:hypothetical protein
LQLDRVALASVLAREGLVYFLNRHGASITRLSRVLDAFSGVLLVVIGAVELLRLLNPTQHAV